MRLTKSLILLLIMVLAVKGSDIASEKERSLSDSVIITNQRIQKNIADNYNFAEKIISEGIITLSSPVGMLATFALIENQLSSGGNYALAYLAGAAGGLVLPISLAYLFNQIRRIIARSRLDTKYESHNVIDHSTIFVPLLENYDNYSFNLGVNYFNFSSTGSKGRPGLVLGMQNLWISSGRIALIGKSFLINHQRCLLKNRIIRKKHQDKVSYSKSNLHVSNNSLGLGLLLNYNLINATNYQIKTGIGYGIKLHFPYQSEEVVKINNISKNGGGEVADYDYHSVDPDLFLPLDGTRYMDIALGYFRDNYYVNIVYQKDLVSTKSYIGDVSKEKNVIIAKERGQAFRIVAGLSL